MYLVFKFQVYISSRTEQKWFAVIYFDFSAALCGCYICITHSTNRNDEVRNLFMENLQPCSSFYCTLTFDMEPIILRNTKRISPYLRVINVIKRRYQHEIYALSFWTVAPFNSSSAVNLSTPHDTRRHVTALRDTLHPTSVLVTGAGSENKLKKYNPCLTWEITRKKYSLLSSFLRVYKSLFACVSNRLFVGLRQ